ncbi:response regulator transcription factor [Umezawaea sp. Da 62-37]|uniref:response regulator transcription factor n=1 Tax=Umezawaea sp. Da 62-37 TaxID=3075927 RepID=UPI0028F6EAD7|nr:response regulator transcription factor [Umezawaea sp. Da 62-37]WNV88085.1 response regulator transcription factor [Umezawaea sp. Da 62-37]
MSNPVGAEPISLLLVEDDREVAAMLAELFTSEGYQVDIALDGQRGLHLALSRKHRIMVLDRGLPGVDGLDLLVRLRRAGVTARVLMLTGRGDVTARVEGLNAGADDYLGKPFELDELLARVNALHRRHLEHTDLLPLGGGHLDLLHREVLTSSGDVVKLSARECDLLRTLAIAPNNICRRTDLRTQVFPEATSESIVDTYVHYLRRKLGREAVRTVHGLGYRAGAV